MTAGLALRAAFAGTNRIPKERLVHRGQFVKSLAQRASASIQLTGVRKCRTEPMVDVNRFCNSFHRMTASTWLKVVGTSPGNLVLSLYASRGSFAALPDAPRAARCRGVPARAAEDERLPGAKRKETFTPDARRIRRIAMAVLSLPRFWHA